VWSKVAKNVIYIAFGATFLGQAVAIFRQLSEGENQFED
jgi:hypothetical protein